jgi:hypothetical protein
MATEFCQKCKQSHPGRPCDYNEQGECEETAEFELPVAEPPRKDSNGKTTTH